MIGEESSKGPPRFAIKALQEYLSSLYAGEVRIRSLWRIDSEKSEKSKDLKGFGYGFPYVIEFAVGGKVKRVVLETLRSEGFGHDDFSDRAQILIWEHSVFGRLPRHVRSIDIGAFTSDGKRLRSLRDCGEFFILTDFVEGKLYHLDLDNIRDTGAESKLDVPRCLALSDYLVDIHKIRRECPWLYVRRARELVGHGECIMGLLDSYPPELDFASESSMIDVERDCVVWRWRLKRKAHRLCQVHGDFHPWNVIFREGTEFTVLDRSRGEWGEAADDVAAMTINYIFYSLQKDGELTGVFERLFRLFWENYLQKTGDKEILDVVQPYYAWRGLVVASPTWYPNLGKDVRAKLLNFVKNVLQSERFDLDDVNHYIREH